MYSIRETYGIMKSKKHEGKEKSSKEKAEHKRPGYAKMEGKPLAMICHGVVGLQHATMAMYNAWCDRVPVFVMGGNIMDGRRRLQVLETSLRTSRSALEQGGSGRLADTG